MTICDLWAALYGDESGSAACFFQWNKNKKGVIIRQHSKKQKNFYKFCIVHIRRDPADMDEVKPI